MVRPSKNNTNLLCIEAGFERKNKFNEAIGKSKSITKVLIAHMDSVIEEYDKQKRLREVALSKSPIKPTLPVPAENSKQSTLDKFFPFWMLDHKNWKLRDEIFHSLSTEQQTEVMIALNHTTKAWSTMKRTKELNAKRRV